MFTLVTVIGKLAFFKNRLTTNYSQIINKLIYLQFASPYQRYLLKLILCFNNIEMHTMLYQQASANNRVAFYKFIYKILIPISLNQS
jgi:hypothetical protein